MGPLTLLSLASLCVAGPAVAAAVLLWRADPGERDFVNHIVVLLALGAAVPPLLIRLAEAVFGLPGSMFPVLLQPYAPAPLSVWTGLVQEGAKGAVVLGAFAWMRRGFADALDGLVIGALVGAGVALAQGLVYLEGLASVAQVARLSSSELLAIGLAGLTQCAFTAVFGASLGSVRGTGRLWFVPVIGFAAASVYHMAYVGLGTLSALAPPSGLAAAAGIARAAVDWSGVALVIVASWWGWNARGRRGPRARGAPRRGPAPLLGAALAVAALLASAAVILAVLGVVFGRPETNAGPRPLRIALVLERLGPNQRPVQETNAFAPGDVIGATATPEAVPGVVRLQAVWLRSEADHAIPIRDPERLTIGPAASGRAETFSLAGAPPGFYVFMIAQVGPGRALHVVAAQRFFVE